MSYTAPAGGLKFKRLTYVGTGARPNLVPIPFKPRLVRITQNVAPLTSTANEQTYLLADGFAIQITTTLSVTDFENNVEYYTNGNLDVGGMAADFIQVGTMNANGVTYTLYAIG